ncbi:MAG TPA: inorganic diphosphatase [Candidatus Paceibacterota bacterium]
MNLWHDVSIGENAPKEVNVIVEIPKGSNNKYELDKETGLIKLDRANYNSAAYPCEYGFIPQTLWEDGDAIDVLLLATYPIHPGVLVSARPVGLMKMTDGGESDDKVIVVPIDDMRWNDVNDIGDLNKHSLREFKHYFETIKQLKGKPIEVTVHEFLGKAVAIEAINKSVDLYKKKFSK